MSDRVARPQDRRRAGRRRHHERHSGRAAAAGGAGLVDHAGRAPRRRGRRKQRPVEQRGHRPLGAVRVELHPGAARRLDRHHQGRARQRAVPGVAAVLGAMRSRTACSPDVRSFLNPIPHVSFVHGRRPGRLPATPPRGAGAQSAVRVDGVHRRRRRVRAAAAADGRQARLLRPGRAELDAGRHRRRLRLAVQAADRLRRAAAAPTTLFGHEVRDLQHASPTAAGRSRSVNRRTGETRKINAKFVFVGAGGGALPLLQKSGINEAKGFGGFPVGGKFLRSVQSRCWPPRHRAKVYGFPPLGAPPMSAPHLDARIINGKSWLLFGPFAGWSPKFLKQGKVTDLPLSVKPNNLVSMLGVGLTADEPGELSDRPAAALASTTGWTRCANSRPAQSIPIGRRRRGAARAGDPPGEGQGRRAGVRHHRAVRRRRQHRRPARCVTGCVDGGACDARRDASAASPTATRRGCPSSRRWCRRWAPNCPASPRCSRKCGRGAPRCSSWTSPPAACPPAATESTAGTEHSPTAASV